MKMKSNVGRGGKLFSVVFIVLMLAACGGSENKEETLPEATDSGIVEDDAGIIEEDVFINIPAGSFYFGDLDDTVALAAFKLGKTPVTVAKFKKCVEARKCTSEHYGTVSDKSKCNYNRGDEWLNHPMNCVDWYGAKEYCEWIGKRLPTEEEWEYASTHNGTEHLDTTYPWGDDIPTSSIANYNSNVGSTTEVGRYSPAGDSPLGLVDMAGNVWEWTSSSFGSTRELRVLKGGSWVDDRLSVWNGFNDDPTDWDDTTVGFRCAE